jgi:hypothetical protein
MHFDEFQSDLSRGAINQIERAKEDGSMSPEEATKHSEDIKKIIKIVSHPFKNINHAIMAAAHSVARDKGITSTSMDLIEDQAKQSGMNIEKGLPGHMQQTYKQFPEDIGYETKLKKEIMPNTKAPENEFQFRKLIKSYSAFKFLRK